MPQLDPNHWLDYFIMSWATLLMLAFPLVLKHATTNSPAVHHSLKLNPSTPDWPWA